MKNWLYIPFLVLMALTYTRLVDNYKSTEFNRNSREPASFANEEKAEIENKNTGESCEDYAANFNPHLTKKCL